MIKFWPDQDTEIYQDKNKPSLLVDLTSAGNFNQVIEIFVSELRAPTSEDWGVGSFDRPPDLHTLSKSLGDWFYINWGKRLDVGILGWDFFVNSDPFYCQRILNCFFDGFVRAAGDIRLIHLESGDIERYNINPIPVDENIELISIVIYIPLSEFEHF